MWFSNQQHQSDTETSELPRHGDARWLAMAPFASIVFLHVVGRFVGGIAFWGISFWSLVPLWTMWGAVAAYVLLSLLSTSDVFAGVITQAPERTVVPRGKIAQLLPWITFIIVTGITVWFLRSQNLVYGDGFSIYGPLARPLTDVTASIHDMIRPLTIILYNGVSGIVKSNFGQGDLSAVSYISVAGGIVGFLGLFATARLLAEDCMGRTIVFCISIAGGSTLLFLGHIEVYVWSTAGLVWTTAISIRYLRTRRGLLLLCSIGVVTALFSVLALPVVAASIVFAVAKAFNGRLGSLIARPGTLLGVCALASVATGVALWLHGNPFVVPILPSDYSGYTLWNWAHIIDLLNLLVFLSGAGIAAILLCRLAPPKPTLSDDETLLMLMAVVGFMVVIWLDPSLGAVRDWDLLAIPGIPLALLGGSMLNRWGESTSSRQVVMVQSALVAAFVLVPLCYDNIHQAASVNRVASLTWEDMHYSSEYQRTGRCIPWGMNLFKDCKRPDLAEKYFRRNVEADSLSHLGWYNLGVVAFSAENFVEAHNDFVRAVRLQPQSETYRQALASTMRILGDYEGADRLLRRVSPEKKQ